MCVYYATKYKILIHQFLHNHLEFLLGLVTISSLDVICPLVLTLAKKIVNAEQFECLCLSILMFCSSKDLAYFLTCFVF